MNSILVLVHVVTLVGFISTGSIILGAIWIYTLIRMVKNKYASR